MAIVVYPGSFDPITNGHIDLIHRAAKLFNKVIVAIALNAKKKTLFSLSQRIELAKQSLADLDQVQVMGFDKLLVDFVQEQQAQVILRGLRAVSDFDYEFQLAGMNRSLASEIETIFLTPAEQYTYISSSLVKEIASMQGSVSAFVNKAVEDALLQQIR